MATTDTNAPPLIAFQAVSLGYGRQSVLQGLDFGIERGDYLGIVGPNGAGKTTLLRALLGVLRPQAGSITRAAGLVTGYVPQLQTVDELFPLTVEEIVVMGRTGQLGPLRRPGRQDRARAAAALAEVGISDLAGRLYRELSGGQKQRTLMARALAADPGLLVLDEPTNDMDAAGEHATMDLLDRLHDERGLTVVMVSHYLNVVLNHVRRIGLLGDGDFRPAPVSAVLENGYLSKLYGVPLRVVRVDEKMVVV